MKKIITTLIFSTLFSYNAQSYEIQIKGNTSIKFSGEALGGYAFDEALYVTSGRERQIFRLNRAIIGADIFNKEINWGGNIEYNFLNDQLKYELDSEEENTENRETGKTAKEQTPFYDYYKNLGSDIYYYGNSNLSNAYLKYKKSFFEARFGRMKNFIGFDDEETPYHNLKNIAPLIYYKNKEIYTGVATLFKINNFLELNFAVLSGAGKPINDYNAYINSQATDANIKGNNTPIIEGKIAYNYNNKKNFVIKTFISYHKTKVGSSNSIAETGAYSAGGKFNDIRQAIGTRILFGNKETIRLDFLAEYAKYIEGLTEEGAQGRRDSPYSLNIKRDGFFVTAGLNFYKKLSLYYTYEHIDRFDYNIWSSSDFANTDKNSTYYRNRKDVHLINQIYQIDYNFNNYISSYFAYRKVKNPYRTASFITDSRGQDDKLMWGIKAKF